MATRFGDAGPVFGLVSESTGFVQEFNQKRVFDEAMVEQHDGTTVTYLLYNGKYEGSITLIDKTGGTLPDAATSQIIANLQTITKVILVDAERKPEQKGFQKTTYTFKAFDGITL
jgi:hypothetical protein